MGAWVRGSVGYMSQIFTWVTWLKIFFMWVIIFTWVVWVKYIFAWVKIFCVGLFVGCSFYVGWEGQTFLCESKIFLWVKFYLLGEIIYYTTTNCFASLFPTNLDQSLFDLFSIFDWLSTKGRSRNPATFYMELFVTLCKGWLPLKQCHKELSLQCCRVLYTPTNAINIIPLGKIHCQTNSLWLSINLSKKRKKYMD